LHATAEVAAGGAASEPCGLCIGTIRDRKKAHRTELRASSTENRTQNCVGATLPKISRQAQAGCC